MDENKTVAIRVEMPPDLRNRFKSAVARETQNNSQSKPKQHIAAACRSGAIAYRAKHCSF
ncbi:MAG: hypothetical protein EAZ60_10625 [Oscillatoriales cyanobacterium]|nr:MAG: hypothetical protein EAZ60_10625 [Oscillatoriales cyanobacterium]